MQAALPRIVLVAALAWAGPAASRQTDLTAPPSAAGGGMTSSRTTTHHPASHSARTHAGTSAASRHGMHGRVEIHPPSHSRATSHRVQTTPHRAAAHAMARKAAPKAAIAAGVVAGAAAAAGKAAAPVAVPKPPVGTVTGLPLPRFAALRSDDVNLRSGPGTRYPILWVYKRRDLPVRVEREFDVWRLIEDQDGTKGWVNQATLIGTRTFVAVSPTGTASDAGSAGASMVSDDPMALRAQPAGDAATLAIVRPGVTGRILVCGHAAQWCRVQVRGVTGFLRRDAMWGLLPDEDVSPPA